MSERAVVITRYNVTNDNNRPFQDTYEEFLMESVGWMSDGCPKGLSE